jgi:hypothetical protein
MPQIHPYWLKKNIGLEYDLTIVFRVRLVLGVKIGPQSNYHVSTVYLVTSLVFRHVRKTAESDY